MRVTRWTDNHEVKSRGSCCGQLRDQLVRGAKIFNRNAGTHSCPPNYTVPYKNGQTCLQDLVPQSDTGGDNGKKLPRRACYRQAATPVGTFTLPLPNTTTLGINLQALQNSQNCITGRPEGGVPPTQQARPVPSLQTALPYLVKGGAQQTMFRSCLLSRYAVIYERDTPPSTCSSAMYLQMQITHAISHLTSIQRDFHADPLNGSTPFIWATEPDHFLSPLCSNLELNLHVGMWSCTVRHGNTANFHTNHKVRHPRSL